MTTISEVRAERLSTEPLHTAGPASGVAGGFFGQIKDLWAHRQLLDRLVRRELKARYKDSALGFVWSLARPLAMLLIYYIALGKFLGAARAVPDFAIYIYTGLTAWGLFSEAVLSGTGSIVGNSGLVKKVYLPREVFPLATMGSALFNFAIQLVILFAATVAVGKTPVGERWVYFPISVAVLVVTALAWSLLLSAVNVYLRDIQYLVEIGIMIFFWASPIAYSWNMVAQNMPNSTLQTIYLTNPITIAIMGFQQTFWVAGDDVQAFPDNLMGRLTVWLVVGVVFTYVAQRVFARLQGNFAQEL